MVDIAREPVVAPQVPWRTIGLGFAILALLLAMLAAIAAGGRPSPFGLADNGLLAVEIDGAIVVMSPDGSNMRRLDLPFSGITGMSFSRDGTRLAAWATPDAGRGSRKSLIVANADGSGAFEVDHANLVTGPGFRIAWSPDDRRVAFSGSGDQLFVADIDARTIVPIGSDASIRYRNDPAWAPDGRLAYRCTTTDGAPRLCVMSADYQTEQILQTSRGTEFAFQAPSWSHDGSSIAYQVDDEIDPQPGGGFGWDVATIDVATGVERILTRGFAPHTILPVWSPDNRHVLFVTADGPGVVRADGTALEVFAGPCNWNEPSPDGAFVVCLRSDQVVLYPIAGGRPTVIELDGRAGFVSWQRLGD